MIVQIAGKLVEKREQSVIINVHGLFHEVLVPSSVLARLEEITDQEGNIQLITYYYFQIGQSSGVPVMIGFINEVERDFFLHFIKVSGVGPRAAVKALNKPISEITQAIDTGDVKFLKTLPGIGQQKAKEIVAKLQGKIGKFGLIQDKTDTISTVNIKSDWQEDALEVLLQLQYKKKEALDMIHKALERSKEIKSTEELLNEIYKQRVNA
ncbi:hypothetical protein MNBD_UNCLBAC01-1965 [hydrothermal vent metagenome]|uniref:DNA helicase Holliday junction RuvA type domain-containing protein n=1 Tax=hydrothermal vent metagenome TaxID=652676 RepID=A0A3B1D343_9ZZZZ